MPAYVTCVGEIDREQFRCGPPVCIGRPRRGLEPRTRGWLRSEFGCDVGQSSCRAKNPVTCYNEASRSGVARTRRRKGARCGEACCAVRGQRRLFGCDVGHPANTIAARPRGPMLVRVAAKRVRVRSGPGSRSLPPARVGRTRVRVVAKWVGCEVGQRRTPKTADMANTTST